MESTVELKIDVTVEPGTIVYRYNENETRIESLRVIETHIVKVPWMDEYGNKNYRSCLDKQSTLKPSYVELVGVERNDTAATNKFAGYVPLESVWLTPEEAMEAYSKETLAKFKKYHK